MRKIIFVCDECGEEITFENSAGYNDLADKGWCSQNDPKNKKFITICPNCMLTKKEKAIIEKNYQKWTNVRPNKEGWYWHAERGSLYVHAVYIREIFSHPGEFSVISFDPHSGNNWNRLLNDFHKNDYWCEVQIPFFYIEASNKKL